MNRSELNKFMQRSISEQGSASSTALARLAIGLQGYIPYVIDISSTPSGKEDSDTMIYKVLNSQNEIDTIIDAANEEKFFSGCVRIKNENGARSIYHIQEVNIQDDYIGCAFDSPEYSMQLMLNKREESYLLLDAKTN
jgi:hypothetical protein